MIDQFVGIDAHLVFAREAAETGNIHRPTSSRRTSRTKLAGLLSFARAAQATPEEKQVCPGHPISLSP